MKNYINYILILFFFASCITPNSLFGQDCSLDKCASIDCGSLNVKFIPEGGPTFCDGEEITIFNSSDSGFDMFIIDWSDGTLDTVFNYAPVSHVYTIDDELLCDGPLRPFSVCFKGEKSCAEGTSCQSGSYDFSVKFRPKAEFGFNQLVCINEPVEFLNESCNGNTYKWDFGDGNFSTLESPTHSYSTFGKKMIKLEVFNDCGKDEIFHEVEVIGLPEANIDISLMPLSGCTNLTVDLDNVLPGNFNRSTSKLTISPLQGWFYADTIYNEFSWDNQIKFTQPGEYTINIRIENICGFDEWTETITVKEAPTATLTSPGSECLENPGDRITIDFSNHITTTGSTCGFNWKITNLDNGQVQNSSSETPRLTFDKEGEYEVVLVIDGCDCGDLTKETTFYITSPANLSFVVPSPEICSNADPITIIPSLLGGQWTGSVAINNDGVFDPAKARVGVNELTYSVGNGACESSEKITIVVKEAPTVSIKEVPPVCDNLVFTPDVNAVGNFDFQVWQVIYENGQIEPVATNSNVSINQPGNHQFVAILDGDCGLVTDTIDLEIQSIAPIVIEPVPSPLCSTSSPFTLVATPEGGTWSGTGVLGDVFDPSIPNSGTPVNVTYEYGEGVCSDSKSIQITVTPSAQVDVEDNVLLCEDSQPYQLTFEPAGGNWSGVGFSADGMFNPIGLSSGNYEGVYELEDASGCIIEKSTIVEVEEKPTIEVDDIITFCKTTNDINLIDNLSIFNLTPNSGTATFSGSGVVDDSGIFNSTKAGANGVGLYWVYIDYQLRVCQVRDSFQIEVIESQVADAGMDQTFCISQQTTELSGFPSGGKWLHVNGNGAGLNSSTGELDLTAAGGGTHRYRYVFSEGTSCEVFDEVVITVIDLTGVNGGPDKQFCENALDFQFSGNNPNGYWSGPQITSDGLFSPSKLTADSTYFILFCVDDPSIDCESCDEVKVTINPNPTANFEIIGTNCLGEPIEIQNNSTNGCVYYFDFGNGQTSSAQTPSPVYNQVGDYTISLITQSCENCRDTFQYQISVTEPATAKFAIDSNEGCAIFEANFINQSFGTDMQFFWDFGNGITSTLQSPGTIQFDQGTKDTIYIIELEITNGCGVVKHVDSVKVKPIPLPKLGTNVSQGCSPLYIEFGNKTLGNPETFEWYIDGVLVSRDSILPPQFFTTTATAITEYIIELRAFNSCGMRTVTKTITVFPPNVSAFIDANNIVGCAPFGVQFNEIATIGANLNWNFGDGNTSIESNPYHIFEEAGTYIVTLTASNCGSDTDTITITVLPSPEVFFTHEPFVCVGQSIQFINETQETYGTSWEFGDGDTSSTFSPTHIFQTPGIYTVRLTEYSKSNNCPMFYESTVRVIGNPNISFEPSSLNNCPGVPVDFIFTGDSTVRHFEWDFGNGVMSNLKNPTGIIYEEPGTYSVVVIGTDDFGCFSDTSILNLIVYQNPVADFTLNKDTACLDVDTFQVKSNSVDIASSKWWFQNDSIFNNENASFVPIDTGDFQISFLVTNAFGCSDLLSKNVSVLGTPRGEILVDKSEICLGDSVEISIRGMHYQSFVWSFEDDNLNSTLPVFSHVFEEVGSQKISIELDNENGCPTQTINTFVEVRPNPISDFDLSDTLVCGLQHVIHVTNKSIDATNFDWSAGSFSSILSEPTISFEQPQDIDVRLLVENEFGCQHEKVQPVSINHQPVGDMDPLYLEECAPKAVTHFAIGTNANSWNWTFYDGSTSTEQNPTMNYNEPGVFDIQCIYSFNGKCHDTLSLASSITMQPRPVSDFTYEDLENGFIQFTGLPQNAVSVEWDFGNGKKSNEISPLHEYYTNGEKEVSFTAVRDNGCTDTKVMGVTPELFYGVYFPNAMSPESGDGEVRVFKPIGIGLKNIRTRIYSQWGELLWDNSELEAEQPAGEWDGTYNGKVVPQGAYVWFSEFEYVNGVVSHDKGTVTVIR